MPLTKATTNVVNLDKDTLINGLTIGKGGGNFDENSAIGINALRDNTTGTLNTAVGAGALANNETANNNTAVGAGALYFNEGGNTNTGVGVQAGASNTEGNGNTAIGYIALYSNTDGVNNTAVGKYALQNNIANAPNGYNCAVGYNSLNASVSGIENTACGASALRDIVTGSQNTALGRYALHLNDTIYNSTGIGNRSAVTGSNQVQLGDSATTTYAYGAVQNRSDIRDKADVRDTQLGLDFVNALRPVDFKWDMREDYRPEAPQEPAEDASDEEKSAYKEAKAKWIEDVKLANITHDGSKKRNRFHHGLIAQEVKAVLEAKGIDFGGFQDHSVKGGDDVLSIGYVELIAPMLKAIQELSAKVAELEAK